MNTRDMTDEQYALHGDTYFEVIKPLRNVAGGLEDAVAALEELPAILAGDRERVNALLDEIADEAGRLRIALAVKADDPA